MKLTAESVQQTGVWSLNRHSVGRAFALEMVLGATRHNSARLMWEWKLKSTRHSLKKPYFTIRSIQSI